MKITLNKNFSINYDFMNYMNLRYLGVVPLNYEELAKDSSLKISADVLREVLSLNQPYLDIVDLGIQELDDTSSFLFQSINEVPSFFLASMCDYTDEKIIESLTHHFNTPFDTLESIITWNVSSNLNETDKFKILMLVTNRIHISHVLDQYLSDHKKTLNQLNEYYSLNFHKLVENFDITSIEKFLTATSIEIPNSADVVVNLTPLVPIHIKAHLQDEVDGVTPLNLYLSPNSYEIYELSETDQNLESKFQECAKVLSEPKKYEILKLCIGTGRYGNELAKSLGVSGATISHHVNQLVNLGYLNITMEKNRVYYKTNHANVINDIMIINDIFK